MCIVVNFLRSFYSVPTVPIAPKRRPLALTAGTTPIAGRIYPSVSSVAPASAIVSFIPTIRFPTDPVGSNNLISPVACASISNSTITGPTVSNAVSPAATIARSTATPKLIVLCGRRSVPSVSQVRSSVIRHSVAAALLCPLVSILPVVVTFPILAGTRRPLMLAIATSVKVLQFLVMA